MEKSEHVLESHLSSTRIIYLPAPRKESDVSLEQALENRRSTRDYTGGSIDLSDVSQLLWSAQGETSTNGYRAAPSAGALFPLELYLLATNVKDLKTGIYKYIPSTHSLRRQNDTDVNERLAELCFDQTWITKAAVDIFISAVYERTTIKYGDRGIRYIYLEAGHAAQNICLQATVLGLGATTVGAFSDQGLKATLSMSSNEFPLYLLTIGKKL